MKKSTQIDRMKWGVGYRKMGKLVKIEISLALSRFPNAGMTILGGKGSLSPEPAMQAVTN